jgi:NADH-quinone oxidoreductase subunit A
LRGRIESIMLEQYFPILLFIIVGVGMGMVLLTVGRFVAPNRPDPEKLSPYECGFEAFEDARMRFDVRYYLIAILFILFDLEIAFLFPWAVVLRDIGSFGFWSMMIFLAILIVGFVYEWKKGALEWE